MEMITNLITVLVFISLLQWSIRELKAIGNEVITKFFKLKIPSNGDERRQYFCDRFPEVRSYYESLKGHPIYGYNPPIIFERHFAEELQDVKRLENEEGAITIDSRNFFISIKYSTNDVKCYPKKLYTFV